MYQKSVDLFKGFYHVRFRADDSQWLELLKFIKSLPGRRFDSVSKVWIIPVSKETERKLLEAGFTFSSAAKIATTPVLLPKQEFKPHFDVNLLDGLFPFQVEGVDFVDRFEGNAIIGDEMGLGKTVQGIGYLKVHPELRPALIVCPSTGKWNWEAHVSHWLKEEAYVLSGQYKPDAKLPDVPVYILNYDILAFADPDHRKFEAERKERLIAQGKKYRKAAPLVLGWVHEFIKKKIKVLILDEAHRIGNKTAIRTVATKLLVSSVKPKMPFLSGTPIRDRPRDFFEVLHMQRPKLFPNERAYLWRYCGPKHNGFAWTYDGLSNADELHAKIQNVMIRRLKKDVQSQLPPKMKSIVPLELDQRVLKEYAAEFEANMDQSEEGIISWSSSSKMRLLTWKAKQKSVLEWIEDFLEIEQKLILFAWHTEVLMTLMDSLKKYNPVLVDGSVSSKKRFENQNTFQTDPNCRVFCGQLEAAGENLTLTAAFSLAFVEFGFNKRQHDQAEDRGLRIGQTSDKYMIYYLVGKGTSDDLSLDMIADKADMSDVILDGSKKEKDFFQRERTND